MNNSLDRVMFEDMMVKIKSEATSINNRVDGILKEKNITKPEADTDKEQDYYTTTQTIANQVISESVTNEGVDCMKICHEHGFSSFLRLSDNVYLAEKNGKRTLTSNDGTPLSMEAPGNSDKIQWFSHYGMNGDGIIFWEKCKKGRFFRYNKSDGKYTGILQKMQGNTSVDISPGIIKIMFYEDDAPCLFTKPKWYSTNRNGKIDNKGFVGKLWETYLDVEV